jgi:hypothetical protein
LIRDEQRDLMRRGLYPRKNWLGRGLANDTRSAPVDFNDDEEFGC